MKYQRKKRKTDRGKLGFVFSLLVFIAVLLIVSLSAGLFFKVTDIEVEGTGFIASDAVVAASEITLGENLIFINKNTASRKILELLPYVDEVRIRRRLPGTVVIEVQEAKPMCFIEHMDYYWKVSGSGKLLESSSLKDDTVCPEVKGATLVAPAEGSHISFSSEEKDKEQTLVELLTALEDAGILEDIYEIDLSKSYEVHMSYLGRFEVVLGLPVDIDYKLSFLKPVVSQLEPGASGKLDLSTAHQDAVVHFVPNE